MALETNYSKALVDIQLTQLIPKEFTGKLAVKSPRGKQWILYFVLGEIAWASESYHPYRSWQRHLKKFCFQIELSNPIFMEKVQKFECWKYYLLTELWEQKIITLQQLEGLIKSKVSEVIFDILQEEASQELHYTWKSESMNILATSRLKMFLVQTNIEQSLTRSQQEWSEWFIKGLKQFSPNLAPVLKKPKLLQKSVYGKVDRSLFQLIDGRHTLRDLGIKMRQEVIDLTHSLIPFGREGYLEFKEISDLAPKDIMLNSYFIWELSNIWSATSKPLIACIDDSPHIHQIMKLIANKAGLRFIGISDPLQAVPTLITNPPDIIFLDIGMPIINGYEICAQLKRVSKLKNIPIIILTGKDSVVDRVRARICGASDFLNKTIEFAKISEILEKHLSVNLRTNFEGSPYT